MKDMKDFKAGVLSQDHVDEMLASPFDEDEDEGSAQFDMVNHPPHYTAHKSGIECIQVTEHLNFCLGNAIKYIWRADLKNGIEDLKKAAWYINREIERRSKGI